MGGKGGLVAVRLGMAALLTGVAGPIGGVIVWGVMLVRAVRPQRAFADRASPDMTLRARVGATPVAFPAFGVDGGA
jgi:hypothetical protein